MDFATYSYSFMPPLQPLAGFALSALVQLAFVFAFAPLLIGLMRKIKAILQGRRGSPVIQPYYDLHKLFLKGTVSSKHSSWISNAAPIINFSAVLAAALAIPIAQSQPALAMDLITFAYVLALGRFAIALCGLDSASAFGGLGSSREMMFATIIEPAFFMVVVFAFSLGAGSQIQPVFENHDFLQTAPAAVLGAIALAIIILAELGRLPFDNPATHLELTMVHEAMILEASGPKLALIEWAQAAKAFIFLALLAVLFLPVQSLSTLISTIISQIISSTISPVSSIETASAFASQLAYPLAVLFFVLISGVLAAAFESFTPKARLFRAPALLVFAFCCATIGILSSRFDSTQTSNFVSLLGFAMLLTSFYLLLRAKFSRRVETYAFQSLALALILLSFALETQRAELWLEFGITLVFKIFAFPYILLRSMDSFSGSSKSMIDFDPLALRAPIRTPAALLLSLFFVFAAFLFSSAFGVQNVLLPIALSMVLIGLIIIAVKPHLLLQVLGFLMLENGLVLLPLALSVELPVLGMIATIFDLVTLVVVSVVLSLKIKQAMESLDSQKLSLLKEAD